MGKKNKDEAPNPSSIANRDILQRLNFLYQASVYLDSVSRQFDCSTRSGAIVHDEIADASKTAEGQTSASAKPDAAPIPRAKGKRHRREIRAADIGQGYVRSMRLIGQKTTVKMDPTVKRTLCKGCDTVLIPGASAIVRVNRSSNHRHLITTTCLRCRLARRIPAPPVPVPEPSESELGVGALSSEHQDETSKKARRRRGPPPRLPPLFEREGHVVFRGHVQIKPRPP
ncbi:RNAse P Rpr2/Rpp21/SNM1 subunit domain-containing protein [Gloeopeniophorella convolvens]|nr:RNAse P Rpr2/Rpp21/SNM1 subunit domain-containing protein [Gloeopeniophorella convolvens]